LNGRPTLQEIIEVQRQFGLPDPALVEKDWFVIRALAAMAEAEKGRFQLVFQGGTALSRAHRVIRRMSEDIDLKIIAEKAPTRAELSRLRDTFTAKLLEAGFEFDPDNEAHVRSMHKNTYTVFRLPYQPVAPGAGILRPEIQIETSVFPVRRSPVMLPVASYIAEAYGRPAEVPELGTAAIVETAAEKFVALTRRAGSEMAGLRESRDPTLARHIYDLHVIREHYDPAEVAALAREIMREEAVRRAKNYPAYRDDPLSETLQAVERMSQDRDYATAYEALRREMVYGDQCDFGEAMSSVLVLAEHLRKVGK